MGHSAFPFSMVRISTLLLCALMAVLIPDNTNALCCSLRSAGSCPSHNGHTCNIFCCNCGGGRPGTSKCLPGTGRKRRSVHGYGDYGVAPWEMKRWTRKLFNIGIGAAGNGGLCTAMALHPGRQFKNGVPCSACIYTGDFQPMISS